MVKKARSSVVIPGWIAIFVAIISISPALAEPTPSHPSESVTHQTVERGRLRDDSLTISPINLTGGGTLSVISPEKWDALGETLGKVAERAHRELTSLMGPIPPITTAVRLMDRETFLATTHAPEWTNALYLRGEILIPLSEKDGIDGYDLIRSVRHEFTHAVNHELTSGRCPGWLDEGIAQWMEGAETPALAGALVRWLDRGKPVPLSLMQGGFTKMESAMVPAAYAQSLYSASFVIRSFGFPQVRRFFNGLRDGEDKSMAFEESFGLSERDFERALGASLNSWSSRYSQGAELTLAEYKASQH